MTQSLLQITVSEVKEALKYSLCIFTLLLKSNKDPLLCSSYRPISLLKVDFKILVKVLAGRLQRVTLPPVNPDQIGFILERHSFSHTQRLLNLLYSPTTDSPELVLSLDAEKAFDHVEWRNLFYVLNRFGLSPGFKEWTKLLYASPVALV